ncbi:MAG TPA: LpqN/LpqT family lipoprotein [Mycobacterium sp.]|nr:LpqN/LpqT family lipoprotein [Mycobacterium sp.]HUH69658.1 LpqN/LpqT family lipoprotein [Mycobacterium sp.]
MKYITAAISTVALGLVLVGCGSDNKSNKTSTTSTSTSASASATSSATSTAPAAGAKYTIADYIRDNHITENPVHQGDPGSPTINLPMPTGWKPIEGDTGTSYGGIVLAQPANPADPPTIVAQLSKLTGDVDQAKLLQYAPGDLQNLPEYQGSAGNASTLGGFQAWQLSGSYTKNRTKRTAAQKTVVIPAQGAVFVLELDADSLESDHGTLMDAADIIDDQTTITT